jgi:hypothetical protein
LQTFCHGTTHETQDSKLHKPLKNHATSFFFSSQKNVEKFFFKKLHRNPGQEKINHLDSTQGSR